MPRRPLSHFDQLSEDALECIIRQFSDRPRHQFWSTFISPEDACWLLCEPSPLRNVSRKRLTHLTVTRDRRVDNGMNIFMPNVEGASIYAHTNGETAAVRQILENAGEYLDHLCICFASTSVRDSAEWLEVAGRRCTSLKRLQILERVEHDIFTNLIRQRGRSLRSLSVWLFGLRGYADAIARHCTALESLEISALRENNSTLWRRVGETLRSLHVTFARPIDAPATLRDISMYCRQLEAIAIPGAQYHVSDENVADLYISFGAQLRTANVKELSPVECARVAEACPNLRVTAGHRTHVVAQMLALGPRVSELLFHPTPPPDVNVLRIAADACAGVEQICGIELSAWSAEHFRALFSSPKRNLTAFKWMTSWPCDLEEDYFFEVMRLLSTQTGNLKRLSISVDISRVGAFRDIARNNPGLQRVRICLLGMDNGFMSLQHAEALLRDIIESFQYCTTLSELHIAYEGGIWASLELGRKLDSVLRSCRAMLRKGTFIQIGTIDYLP